MSGDKLWDVLNRRILEVEKRVRKARYQFEGTGIDSIPMIKTKWLLQDPPGVEFDWGSGIKAVRLDVSNSLIFYTKVEAGGGQSPYRQDIDKWMILVEGDALDPSIGQLTTYEPVHVPKGNTSSITTIEGCTLLITMKRSDVDFST